MARVSQLRAKQQHFLRGRWPLTIAFSWRLPIPISSPRLREVLMRHVHAKGHMSRVIRSSFNAARDSYLAYWAVDLLKRNNEMEVPLGLNDSDTMRICRPRSARNAMSPSVTRTSRKISGRGFSLPS